MTKAIYFDMDGTLYDLYGIENWLDRLTAEDESAYCDGCPLGDMETLNDLLTLATLAGYVIGVITWTAKNGSKEYNAAVRRVKKNWIAENLPCVSEFHCVQYGTPKHRVAKVRNSILVDDNAEVRAAWKNGDTVDATDFENILNALRIILDGE